MPMKDCQYQTDLPVGRTCFRNIFQSFSSFFDDLTGGGCHLAAAVRIVALLGGYQGRKGDLEPDHEIMWSGQERMTTATLGHKFGFEARYQAGLQGLGDCQSNRVMCTR